MHYANILYNDLVNTDGVALCFYTQGCSHHCKGCFSKQTWDFNGGKELTEDVLNEIKYVVKNYSYDYLCLIGGDPLDNCDVSNLIIDVCKSINPNIRVWVYSGYTLSQLQNEQIDLLRRCDVLIDGQFIEELKDLRLLWRGSSNQRVIDVQKTLIKGEIVLLDS